MDVQLLKAANNIVDILLQQKDTVSDLGNGETTERSYNSISSYRSLTDDQEGLEIHRTSLGTTSTQTRRTANAYFSQAEEFKTSLPSVARLGVHFLSIEFQDDTDHEEVFLEARVESQVQQITKLVSLWSDIFETESGRKQSSRQNWNEMLAFDITNMKNAVLRIRVMKDIGCYSADSMGIIHIPLWQYISLNVAAKAECFELYKKRTLIAKLTLKLILHRERKHVPLKVLCSTWNLGNQQPDDDLRSWFKLDSETSYDLIAVGVQESSYKSKRHTPTLFSDSSDEDASLIDEQCGTRPALITAESFSVRRLGHIGSMLRAENNSKANLEDLIVTILQDDYLLLKSVVMWQIRLLIFVKTDIYPTISSVKTATQATGIGGVGQNKGGIAISFRVWDTHLCFVNCHLAAHQDKVKARNAMYESLLRGIRIDDHKMDLLTGFHHVFWMGDFNYRLDLGDDSQTPSDQLFRQTLEDCMSGKLAELLKKDQLRLQIQQGAAFDGFKEGLISFLPTFKVERVEGMTYNAKRLPAWCDRVLYKSSLPSREAKVLDYYSVPTISSSDHKPVAALFIVPTIFYNYGEDHSVPSVIVLAIRKLQAEGLLMLKKTNKRDATPPNPQVIVSVRGQKVYQTSVVYKKRAPTWRNAIRIKLYENSLEQLQQYRLMFRVVSRTNSLSGYSQTMGRGVLPLDTVNIRTSVKKFSFSFHVKLQYNSKNAGSLTGDIKISLKKQRSRGDGIGF